VRRWPAVLLALAAGCGYHAGLRLPERAHPSVAVEFFGNTSLERDLERDFQHELSRALRDAGLQVDPADRARTAVRGTVRQYHRRSGIRSPDNELLETGVYFEVEGSLWVPGAEAPLRGPFTSSTWVGFVIEPTGANEQAARQRAMRHVAEELVLDLFAPVD